MYSYYRGEAFYGRVNINCRIQFIRDIENNITPADWQRILDGPFGNIMRMFQQVSFSSQTLHAVLFKQLKTKKKWESWYEVGGKELRFSIQEFGIITGLNCGELPDVDSRGDSLVSRRFFGTPSGPKTTVQDLYNRFKEHRVLDNYKMKLAVLLIVEGIILGGDKKRLVRPEHVRLLENMDRFWEYPWGRVAYEELHKSLTTSLDRRMLTVEKARALSKQPRIPYSIQGMPIVFQVPEVFLLC